MAIFSLSKYNWDKLTDIRLSSSISNKIGIILGTKAVNIYYHCKYLKYAVSAYVISLIFR